LGKPPSEAEPGGREVSHAFEVAAAGNAGAASRRQLDSLAGEMDHVTLAKLRLLVSELVNRAAMDTGAQRVQVSLSISPETVRAVVVQPGAPARRGLDWALFLVSRMADRWGIGIGVWFELDRPQQRRFQR
jgi:hypothetical protein